MLIAVDDLESLEETIEVLSDPQLVADIKEGREDFERGDYVTAIELLADLATRVASEQQGKAPEPRPRSA